MKTKYAIQLFSVRDVTKDDLEGAMRAVAEMGYHGVEFAGFFGNSAETVKSWLDKYGLEVVGSHTGAGELTPETIEATVAYNKAIGNKNIIIPSFRATDDGFEELVSTINYALPILKENGIQLTYHNHSTEFNTTETGRCYYSELEERTEVEFEIDTFWAYNAGLDPVALIERLKNRIRLIHLMDGEPSGTGYEKGARSKAIGEGTAPVKRVVECAKALGIGMVVESEGLDPTGPEEVKRCIDYLRSFED